MDTFERRGAYGDKMCKGWMGWGAVPVLWKGRWVLARHDRSGATKRTFTTGRDGAQTTSQTGVALGTENLLSVDGRDKRRGG